jgi:hypothetical protein
LNPSADAEGFFHLAAAEVTTLPPPPPEPAPDTLADSAHPVWQSGDTFRAAFFGCLAVFYAILLFPIAVAVAVLWVIGWLVDRSARRPSEKVT